VAAGGASAASGSRAHRADDGTVVVDRGIAPPLVRLQCGAPRQDDLVLQGIEHGAQALVVGGGEQQVVEGGADLRPLGPILFGGIAVAQGLQLTDFFGAGARRGAACRHAFQRLPQLEQLPQVVHGAAGHEIATAGHRLDQAVAGQDLECFPHWRAAHAHAGGEMNLEQRRAGFVFPFENRLPHALVGAAGQVFRFQLSFLSTCCIRDVDSMWTLKSAVQMSLLGVFPDQSLRSRPPKACAARIRPTGQRRRGSITIAQMYLATPAGPPPRQAPRSVVNARRAAGPDRAQPGIPAGIPASAAALRRPRSAP